MSKVDQLDWANRDVVQGTEALIAGFGFLTPHGPNPKVLQKVTLSVESHDSELDP